MLGVGFIEIAIGLYLLMGKNAIWQSVALFWLSSNFMFYRIASDILNVKLCPCLGTMSQNLPFSDGQISAALIAVVLYFFLGSGALLLKRWSEAGSGELPREFSLRTS